jgi:cobalt-zinc-cadmium efflux system membrane fusion protein
LALAAGQPARAVDMPATDSIDLTAEQVRAITIAPVGQQVFPLEQSAVGSIDFNEDEEAQVFPPYQGSLLALFARTGDSIQKGQVLYTIDSPDLVQAESTLIAAAGVLQLTTRALDRAQDLYRTKGLAQKDFDQAVSDQQTAEGNFRAAQNAVAIFGKTDAEIERIASTRKVDPALVVRSPITGVVVARSGAVGAFVQPGTAPAPFTVADTSQMWMLANASESQSALFKVGQPVSVQVGALPGRVFTGRVAAIGSTIDPSTRRFTLRSEILDPEHVLRSGMFATFTIETGPPLRAIALPMNGIVREGDGTMTAWVTIDRKHFTRRVITVGLISGDFRQILTGLSAGELAVTDGAVFLSNMLTDNPT